MTQPVGPLKLGVVFLGRRRPGFDMDWGRAMEQRVRGWLEKSGFTICEPSEKAVDDASLRRSLAAFEEARVNAVVVLQTTMGDGRLAPTLAQLWPEPIVLWATPEKPDGDMISSCSLVGAHCWASVLRIHSWTLPPFVATVFASASRYWLESWPLWMWDQVPRWSVHRCWDVPLHAQSWTTVPFRPAVFTSASRQ